MPAETMTSFSFPPSLPLAPGPLLQGFALMAGLIVAIGAQNALVLRQGLARRHVAAVVLFCTASDWLLTAAGIFGLGRWIAQSPMLLQVLRFGGAAFLAAYAARAAWSAWHDRDRSLGSAGAAGGLAATLGSAAAMTYLNPHVYLDTVVLVGLVGAQHDAGARWLFAGGSALASAGWFMLLGFGAAWAAPWLRRPQLWRAIDAGVALLMAALALQLLLQAPQAGAAAGPGRAGMPGTALQAKISSANKCEMWRSRCCGDTNMRRNDILAMAQMRQ
jgi:L-lysine exporter family protein LysE/ArgO